MGMDGYSAPKKEVKEEVKVEVKTTSEVEQFPKEREAFMAGFSRKATWEEFRATL